MFPRYDTQRLAEIVKDIDNSDKIDNIALWINMYKMTYGPLGIGSASIKN